MKQESENSVEVSIVLPAFNEGPSVEEEIKRIKRAMDASLYSYELIVVNDGSTDSTAEYVKKHQWVKLINHPENTGSGGARKTGTLAAKGDLVVWSDADLTYPNHEIPRLIEEFKRDSYDQLIGSRVKEAGSYKFLRIFAKWFIKKLASYLTGKKIPDLNSGMRVFKRAIALKYLYLLPDGFSCVSTMTMAFLANRYRVGYFPIDYQPRIGRSKFHPIKDTYNYVLQVIRMVMYFEPLKIFMPLSIFLVGLGSVKLLYDVIAHHFRVTTNTIVVLFIGFQFLAIGLLADLLVKMGKRSA